jgi:hypothetical protein
MWQKYGNQEGRYPSRREKEHCVVGHGTLYVRNDMKCRTKPLLPRRTLVIQRASSALNWPNWYVIF